MREINKIERVVKQEAVTNIKCDVCGQEISGKFWRLSTSHGDWGNDSCESYKHFDICSRECIDKKLDVYMDDCEYSYTQCFELEQDYFKRANT